MSKSKCTGLLLFLAVIFIAGAVTTALADTASVTIRGPWYGVSYTVQFWQNGVLRHQKTDLTLPVGYRTYSVYGLPSGCGYIANVWVNGVGEESHTWPAKCVSGTTHLGCLQFDMSGSPEPWSGSCP